MNLLALQLGIANHLQNRNTSIAAQVRGDAPSRLAVYHNAYRMQLLACLRDTFEKTWSWLGDTRFEDAGLCHIERHAPRSWTLSDYGKEFPHSLNERFPDDPEVAELAWLDWSLRRAFDGPNATSVDAAELADVDWDRALIRFVPTLHVQSISTNCAAIWTAIAEGGMPPSAIKLNETWAIRVWRQDLVPRFRSIESAEQRALAMARAGATFGTICSFLDEEGATQVAASQAGSLLASWLRDGLVTAIESP